MIQLTCTIVDVDDNIFSFLDNERGGQKTPTSCRNCSEFIFYIVRNVEHSAVVASRLGDPISSKTASIEDRKRVDRGGRINGYRYFRQRVPQSMMNRVEVVFIVEYHSQQMTSPCRLVLSALLSSAVLAVPVTHVVHGVVVIVFVKKFFFFVCNRFIASRVQ